MAININQNRINTQPILGGRVVAKGDRPLVPARAALNNIPAPETLATIIRSAISALKSGVFWDRGTILNIVV